MLRQITKMIRISYDSLSRELVLKCMPGPGHPVATSHFYLCVAEEYLGQMNHSLTSVCLCQGATLYQISATRMKQADAVFKPAGGPWGGLPSFVVETRTTETYAMLKQDVFTWLATGEVALVFLMIIDQAPAQPAVELEVWELRAGRVTRASAGTQRGPRLVYLNPATAPLGYVAPALSIPYALLGALAPPGAPDLVVSMDMWAAVVWWDC
ncbi:hypothetical protein B0H17DRAFT_678442 [Mycena rosella]|uniref:Uncharacterized protein n=1 Tax=Mycena rosella TaxID=1033263 RepID=A0AAD7DC75_MYCRO|nr:hypothetical protein B0H17DRAFT_678442 [Mycena rosella]